MDDSQLNQITDASFEERGAMVWLCTDNLVVHHHVTTVFPLDSPVKSEHQRTRQQQLALDGGLYI
ncbi:MAG: hypothetical protein FRX49_08988 [Trebouxia sp. A1-2]|nr:MAG: hypothetical protein FRX49_13769 [Trebouxia sp. A1-2]KAA6421077.1 MAG: hypothetical protein FRX49_08988 [Trebouxia sp. A1-2]